MADENTVPDESASEEQVSQADELGAIFDKANAEETQETEPAPRERDGQGRFASKETTEVVPDATIGAAPEKEPEPETVLDAPASWSATAKAGWSGLARELQDEILKREGDWQKADGERVTKLKGYEPIDAALSPVLQHLQMSGVAPGQYVSQLVAADQALKNPQTRDQAIQWIFNQYGIDPNQQAAPEMDPALAPFVNEINALKSQVSGFVNNHEAQEASRVTAEIDAFAKDRPHFEAVRVKMGLLIKSGAAADMAEAYEQATWGDPTTRTAMQAEHSVEAEAKRKAEVEEKAAKARRVSQTNLSTQGTAGGATPPQYKDREEELGAIYEQVTGA